MTFGLQVFDAASASLFSSEEIIPVGVFNQTVSAPGTITVPDMNQYYMLLPTSGFASPQTALPHGLNIESISGNSIVTKEPACAKYLASGSVVYQLLGMGGAAGKPVPAPTSSHGLAVKNSAGNYIFSSDLPCFQINEESSAVVSLTSGTYGYYGAVYYAKSYNRAPLIFIHSSSGFSSIDSAAMFWHHIVNSNGKFIGFVFRTGISGNVFLRYRVGGPPESASGFGLSCYNQNGLTWTSGLATPSIRLGSAYNSPGTLTVSPAYPNDDKWALLNVYNPGVVWTYYFNFKGSGYTDTYASSIYYKASVGWDIYWATILHTGLIYPADMGDTSAVYSGTTDGGISVVTSP